MRIEAHEPVGRGIVKNTKVIYEIVTYIKHTVGYTFLIGLG